MLTTKQKEVLLKLAPEIKFEEPLKRHTYFQIGGPADAFYRYTNGYDYTALRRLLHFCAIEEIPVTILGGGSNVLISDHGLRGLVLQMHTRHIQVYYNGMTMDPVPLQASGGDQMKDLAEYTMLVLGLTGLEPFWGLPGTVGGAVYNNAHYQHHQLFGDWITKVWTIPLPLRSSTAENFYLKKDLLFRYDHSVFQDQPPELIIAIELELPKGDKTAIRVLAEKLRHERQEHQPLNIPSSGCIFKNPESGLSAGVLIDNAGLKGMVWGGAVISDRHANFIINPHKTAMASEVRQLIAIIKEKISSQYGLVLEEEVFFLDNGKGKKDHESAKN